jgi:DNA-damage-inducible protein D
MSANNEVARLFASFEDRCFKHQGADAWRARNLMDGLGYANWQNFREAIRRAWISAETSGNEPASNFLVGDGSKPWHPDEVFTGVSKNPQGGRPSEDVILTRRAAYLVAMNGDSSKPQIAFAQQYFATSTRTLEVIQQRLVEAARLKTREKLTETEARFQGVVFQHGVDGDGIGRIRSKGDEALFGGENTGDMKKKWGVPKGRPLADFAPEVVNIAKQLGAAITTHNVKANNLNGEEQITDEHVANNEMVRGGVASRGIVLEKLEGEEDIKKIERRHASDARKLTAPPKEKKASKKKGKAA